MVTRKQILNDFPESKENLEEMFPRYYMHSDNVAIFQSYYNVLSVSEHVYILCRMFLIIVLCRMIIVRSAICYRHKLSNDLEMSTLRVYDSLATTSREETFIKDFLVICFRTARKS